MTQTATPSHGGLTRLAPVIRLLDGTRLGGEPELRAAVRALAAPVGLAYVSRSYRHPYALVAWHTDRVGIDIERVEPCEPDFAASICTPAELSRLPGRERTAERERPAGTWDAALISLWSAKEALSKALGDPLRYDPRQLEGPGGWPGGRSGSWRAAALDSPAGHVGWVCWRSVAQRPDGELTQPVLGRPQLLGLNSPPPGEQQV